MKYDLCVWLAFAFALKVYVVVEQWSVVVIVWVGVGVAGRKAGRKRKGGTGTVGR